MSSGLKVALVGNPNTGKSTLFNALTGLNQKVGNFPGITVDKKTGFCRLSDGRTAEIIDLPGTYSLYPKSKDESIVLEVLTDKTSRLYPDLVVVLADASNLKRNLLLYTQVADLKIPVIIALNMMDLARKAGTEINVDELSARLGVRIVPICARTKENISGLKEAIQQMSAIPLQRETIEVEAIAPGLIAKIQNELQVESPYAALQLAHQHENMHYLSARQSDRIEELEQEFSFHSQKAQAAETIARYNFINDVLFDTVKQRTSVIEETISNRIDKVLTHKVWGFIIFFGILFLIFQAIFSWSEYPMSLIEDLFVWLGSTAHAVLPPGVFTDMLVDGVLAGLSGVLVFIPQIAILFAFISILEDTGYMARVTFMMDKIMRKVGLSGKSVVPLIGGLACAVPSIMGTRNIENWKDRIITIMVTPLVSCSARLPIYTLLISLVVPDTRLWGFVNMQGLALMAMYVLGIVSAILVAWVMKKLIKARERGYFIMELPVYRMPRWSNVGLTMYEKVKTFVVQAGKVIIAISVVLWVLATYGPAKKQQEIEQKYTALQQTNQYPQEELQRMKASDKLENSYAGLLGRAIEPAIKPLGYDWKIGIALITSFAAREVFVGTMATIYSVDSSGDDVVSVREKMRAATEPDTGRPVFTLATAFSLMVFYAFAMQCMSTLAIVYRETKSLKWPVIQFIYMGVMAYIASLIVYQVLK
ncbi:ferrous iron transport protein B [Pedobacter sp. BS3]|uniref:ferrous iron transport protein B n=1 Tax=Pedobacter sp. BS3 TaxID=2567937 RepID=UPI0011EDA781|nr:ferrous iron transport protein B [Pedobacter sp. BS3]TZF82214.1 ferrous iron transport protein B [Pedobacter sp. BS3]